jgi:hypothetical protein
VLGCTGTALTEDQASYIEAGADRVLAKPIMLKYVCVLPRDAHLPDAPPQGPQSDAPARAAAACGSSKYTDRGIPRVGPGMSVLRCFE